MRKAEPALYRCAICNRVNSEEIATNKGDFIRVPFVRDPNHPFDYFCLDCSEEIQDVSCSFQHDDDYAGYTDKSNKVVD